MVGVLLDLDARTLAFSINGQFKGIAFEHLAAGDSFYPAVCLYYKVNAPVIRKTQGRCDVEQDVHGGGDRRWEEREGA